MGENRKVYRVKITKLVEAPDFGSDSHDEYFEVEFYDFNSAVEFSNAATYGECISEIELWFGDVLVNSIQQ